MADETPTQAADDTSPEPDLQASDTSEPQPEADEQVIFVQPPSF